MNSFTGDFGADKHIIFPSKSLNASKDWLQSSLWHQMEEWYTYDAVRYLGAVKEASQDKYSSLRQALLILRYMDFWPLNSSSTSLPKRQLKIQCLELLGGVESKT